MAQKTERRAKEVLQLLLQQGKISVEQLAEHFQTSVSSIRRDLTRLEQDGLVHRTYGGVMLARQTYEPFRFDASFAEREVRFQREKAAIATAAAALVKDGDVVGVTAGTTTTQVARALNGRNDVHILTNAINIGLEFGNAANSKCTLTGGCMVSPGALSLSGPVALEVIQSFVLDRVFVGVTGVHPTFGATLFQQEEAAVFRAMVRQAREVVVVADSSKIGRTGHAIICGTEQIHSLITDPGISDEARGAFEHEGVQLIVAGAP